MVDVVRDIANLRREVTSVTEIISPVGTIVVDDIGARRVRSDAYREAEDGLRPFEEIARIVIMRRAQLGLTQQKLAERMGTTKSVISRIESGQHRSGIDTLRRLAEALDGHAVIGFGFYFDSNLATAGEMVRL